MRYAIKLVTIVSCVIGITPVAASELSIRNVSTGGVLELPDSTAWELLRGTETYILITGTRPREDHEHYGARLDLLMRCSAAEEKEQCEVEAWGQRGFRPIYSGPATGFVRFDAVEGKRQVSGELILEVSQGGKGRLRKGHVSFKRMEVERDDRRFIATANGMMRRAGDRLKGWPGVFELQAAPLTLDADEARLRSVQLVLNLKESDSVDIPDDLAEDFMGALSQAAISIDPSSRHALVVDVYVARVSSESPLLSIVVDIELLDKSTCPTGLIAQSGGLSAVWWSDIGHIVEESKLTESLREKTNQLVTEFLAWVDEASAEGSTGP